MWQESVSTTICYYIQCVVEPDYLNFDQAHRAHRSSSHTAVVMKTRLASCDNVNFDQAYRSHRSSHTLVVMTTRLAAYYPMRHAQGVK